MGSRWSLLALPLASVSLLALASSGCLQVPGIHDVNPDDGAGMPDGAGQGGGSGSSSASGDPGAAGFSFSVLSPNVTVPLAGKDVIEIEVRRTGGFTGEVTVTPVGAPTGLRAEPLTIPAGQTSAEIVVSAEAPLAIGNKLSFSLVATSGDLEPRTAAVTDALVIGRPGALDETFGAVQTGLARVRFGGDDGGGFFDLDVIGDKIVAAGQGYGGLGGSAFVVTRLLSSGSIDPTFNMGTPVRTRFGTSSGSSSMAVAVGHQLDGRPIAMGWHEIPTGPDIALERYSLSGEAGDPLFGLSGRSLIDLGGKEQVSDGLVLSNNKILVAGERDGNLMVARVTSDGYLDNSFAAPNGYLTWSGSQPSSAQAVVVDTQGRIVALGHTGPDGQRDLIVARYLQDGQPDMTFGAGGQRILEASGSDERAAAVAVLGDGRILVAGDSNVNGNIDFLVRCLLADGSPDSSFGQGGTAAFPITAADDTAADMVVLPDGRILVVGNVQEGGKYESMLARYTRDGKLDPYFGTGGVLPLYVGDYGSVHCAAVYPGHKVVIGGGDEGGSPGPGTFGVVARLWM